MKMLEKSINKFKDSKKEIVETWKTIILGLLFVNKKSIKINFTGLYKCSECRKQDQSRITLLSCGHSVCYNCLIKQIKCLTDESFDDDYILAKCNLCSTKLKLTEIHSIILPSDIYKRNQEYHTKHSNQEAYTLIANNNKSVLEKLNKEMPFVIRDVVDLQYYPISEVIYMPCRHYTSFKAAIDIIMKAVGDNQITDEAIGCQECTEKRSIFPIKMLQFIHDTALGIISQNILKKISDISKVRKETIFKHEEELLACRGCNNEIFARVNTTRYFCPNCRDNYCPLCNGLPHADCAQAKLQQQKQIEEMKNAGAKTCPHCKNWVIKTNGCNFIYCSSPLCGGQRYFCYLCGCKLNQAKHCAHFHDHPYGNACKGVADEAT